MALDRFCLKFFAQTRPAVDDALFIDIFHDWIRQRRLSGILLDVADYRHVPQGPGVMLVSHHINFAMDYGQGRFGLLAQRKRGSAEALPDKILELVRATVAFGALLETAPQLAGQFQLAAGAFHFISNDRLLAPNSEVAFTGLRPALEAATAMIYPGREVVIARVQNDPRERLTLAVKAGPVTMAELLEQVGLVA